MDTAETRQFYEARGIGARVGFGIRPTILVVDLVVGFTDPASPLGSSLDAEVEATRRLIDAGRRAGAPIHYTTISFADGHGDGGPFLRKMTSLRLLVEGSPLVALDRRLERRASDALWVKKGASAFFGTALAAALTAAGVDTVIVAGCTTSGCVRASVVDACQHGFRTIVVREAVGDRADGPHEASLFDMDAKYADVVSLEETVGWLAAVAAPSDAQRSGRTSA
ncbi:MAG: N-formylmaleamate deformylase [Candidatus Binatota bacterium]|jgi:nicotinamidase-related amidase|nr:N-formylmaleamate deformylase [Candidatus Binatota bacterium]